MKKLANTIFGKESKYHHREGETAEAIASEKYHTKYDEHPVLPPAPAVVPVVPIVEKKPTLEDKLQREIELESRYRPQPLLHPTRMGEFVAREEPGFIETRDLPPVVEERVLPVETEEIQPIVHRDIEKTEIHVVNVPKSEREIRPTLIHEKTLPAEVRPEVRFIEKEQLAEAELRRLEASHQSRIERGPIEHLVVEKPAIIEERVHRKVIEEIQPVIHRETIEPHVIKEVRPIYEKIVEAPIVTHITRDIEALDLNRISIALLTL